MSSLDESKPAKISLKPASSQSFLTNKTRTAKLEPPLSFLKIRLDEPQIGLVTAICLARAFEPKPGSFNLYSSSELMAARSLEVHTEKPKISDGDFYPYYL